MNKELREYAATLSETRRLRILEKCLGEGINESINRRATIAARLDAYRLPNGKVWVQYSSMDCDGVHGYHSYQIEGTLQAFEKEYCEAAGGAEGPFSLYIIPEKGRSETVGHGWGII